MCQSLFWNTFTKKQYYSRTALILHHEIMLTKSEIQHIRSLRERKYRYETRQFTVEGKKLVAAISNSSLHCVGKYSTNIQEPDAILISEKEMSRISQFHSHSEILAVFEMPTISKLNISDLQKGYTLMLDSIQDPGNVGTIIRTAAWFGVQTIICSENCADIYNAKTIQATMGAFLIPSIIYGDLVEILSKVSDKIPVYGTYMKGENYLEHSFIEKKGIIIMGNEGKGIDPKLTPLVTHKLFIPSLLSATPSVESLNVSVATALILQKATLSSILS